MAVPSVNLGIEPLGSADIPHVAGYRLLGLLGAGGMGRVYLGISPGQRLAAVKLVHEEYAADPEFRARFRLETLAARSVSGAFTAPVLDADPAAERPWLAALYVPALTLSEAVGWLGRMPVEAVRALGAALAEALRSVHSAGIMHRDLKPSNVLLTADGPLVIDFGISRALDGTPLTRPGTVIGTVGYMPPEQLRSGGTASGPAGDVFALGCVLGFAAAAEPVFGTGRADEIARRVVREEPRLQSVPAELRPLIMSCVQKDPAARPSTDRLLEQLASPDSETIRTLMPPPLLDAVAARARAAYELAARAAEVNPVLAISAPAPVEPAPRVAPRRRMNRRTFLALAGGGIGAAGISVGGAFALARALDGHPSSGPSWTATVPSSAQVMRQLQGVQSIYFAQDSIALVGGTLLAVGSLSAAAFTPSTGALVWSWESMTSNSAGPEISGATKTTPCGLTTAGFYGWGAAATGFTNDTFFSADASGAVTGQWPVDDYSAGSQTDTLYFCARTGTMAVFVERSADLLHGGVGLVTVTAVDVGSGALSWSFALQNAGTRLTYYTTSVAADSQRIYIQDGPDTYAVDPVSGTTIWHTAATAADAVPTQLALADGGLLVGSTHATAISPADGRVVWRSEGDDAAAPTLAAQAKAAQGPYFNPLSVVGGTAYLCDGSSRVYAFDAATGATKWTYTNQNLRLVGTGGYQPSNTFASTELVAVPIGGSTDTAVPARTFVALAPDTGTPLGVRSLPVSSGGGATAWQLIAEGSSVYAVSGATVCAFEGGF